MNQHAQYATTQSPGPDAAWSGYIPNAADAPPRPVALTNPLVRGGGSPHSMWSPVVQAAPGLDPALAGVQRFALPAQPSAPGNTQNAQAQITISPAEKLLLDYLLRYQAKAKADEQVQSSLHAGSTSAPFRSQLSSTAFPGPGAADASKTLTGAKASQWIATYESQLMERRITENTPGAVAHAIQERIQEDRTEIGCRVRFTGSC